MYVCMPNLRILQGLPIADFMKNVKTDKQVCYLSSPMSHWFSAIGLLVCVLIAELFPCLMFVLLRFCMVLGIAKSSSVH